MRLQTVPLILVALIALILLLAPPSPRPAGEQVACPVTFCASLSVTISVGSAAEMQLGYGLVSMAQAVAVSFTLSQLLIGLGMVRRRMPAALLHATRRLRDIDTKAGGASGSADTGGLELPIESTSGGKITSNMLNSPNFFGPGRL